MKKLMRDYILVSKANESESVTKGGIVLPNLYPANASHHTGVVLMVGPGRKLDDGKHVPIDVEPLDKIVYSGLGVEMEYGDKRAVLIQESQVVAVL